MKLLFIVQKFPRSMTKEEWREVWRWKRLTEKKLAKNEEEMVKVWRDVAVYGIGWAKVREGIVEHLTNPPFLIPDKMELP